MIVVINTLARLIRRSTSHSKTLNGNCRTNRGNSGSRTWHGHQSVKRRRLAASIPTAS